MKKKMYKNVKYPRVLVLSNECFSKISSNGRTLGNFFIGWPVECLAQFFIHGSPDSFFCNKYYQVSDGQSLKAFLFRSIPNGIRNGIKSDTINTKSTSNLIEIKRTPITMLIRERVWASGRWKKYGFAEWVKQFNPEIIMLQAGDSGFMCSLAVELAEAYDIPLLIYNSEAYYFKSYDYLKSKGISHLFYPWLHCIYRNQFKKAISMSACSIYICEELKKAYDKEFGLRSEAIYTATEVDNAVYEVGKSTTGNSLTVSYLGNMGVGRFEALCNFSTVLQKVSDRLMLNIYGNLNVDKVRALSNFKNICYKGFVAYDEVINIMHKSDLVIHVESFDEYYIKDLQYAFSTKIADSLACNTPFLLYAPSSLACSKYLSQNKAAFVATSERELENILEKFISDKSYRRKYIENAIRLVNDNHDCKTNTERFQNLIINAVKR